MIWLTLLKALLSLASSVASYLHEKQLIDAGHSKAIAESSNAALDAVKKAQDARNSLSSTPDDIMSDDANRDAKR